MAIKFNRNMNEAPRTGGVLPHYGPRLLLLYPNGKIRIGNWDGDIHVKKPRPYWSTQGELFGKRYDQDNDPIGWAELVAEEE